MLLKFQMPLIILSTLWGQPFLTADSTDPEFQKGIDWARNLGTQSSSKETKEKKCGRGTECAPIHNSQLEPPIRVFVSLSLPIESWCALSKELSTLNGIFVMRGFPNNSIKDFYRTIMTLRKRGVMAPITIDPEAFDAHQITAIPTILVSDGHQYIKLSGNIPILSALERIDTSQSTSNVKELISKLKKRERFPQ